MMMMMMMMGDATLADEYRTTGESGDVKRDFTNDGTRDVGDRGRGRGRDRSNANARTRWMTSCESVDDWKRRERCSAYASPKERARR